MPRKCNHSGPNTPPDGSLDLPEDSLFTASDYARMYRVAASETGNTILGQLQKERELSERALQARTGFYADELQATLKELQRVALIMEHQRPDRGKDSSYSITRLGKIILKHGAERGISILAIEEECIEATYRDVDLDSH